MVRCCRFADCLVDELMQSEMLVFILPAGMARSMDANASMLPIVCLTGESRYSQLEPGLVRVARVDNPAGVVS